LLPRSCLFAIYPRLNVALICCAPRSTCRVPVLSLSNGRIRPGRQALNQPSATCRGPD
jgi:hypothetical protein